MSNFSQFASDLTSPVCRCESDATNRLEFAGNVPKVALADCHEFQSFFGYRTLKVKYHAIGAEIVEVKRCRLMLTPDWTQSEYISKLSVLFFYETQFRLAKRHFEARYNEHYSDVRTIVLIKVH